MKFAIFVAVSTVEQAAQDRDSLPVQEEKCRAVGVSRGWRDTGKVYSVPGESRTRWVNLRDAEAELPALHELLEDAKARLFDVLILYDYNRLRDLQDPVAKTLNSYGAQLFSVNQPTEPLSPDEFNPYASDAESMMRGMNQIMSRAQISDLRRKHAYGIVGRVKRGLHPVGKAPYGYRLVDKRLVVEPVAARIAVEIKDLYLRGKGVPEIIEQLETKRVPPPVGHHWSDHGIRYLLENPVYCGSVRLGYMRVRNDPRTGKRALVPGKAITEKGAHESLWTELERDQIIETMKQRAHKHKGPKIKRLSCLPYCAEHDRPLRQYARGAAYRLWYCPEIKGTWHLCLKDAELLSLVIAAIVDKYQGKRFEVPPIRHDASALTRARDDLMARRDRLTDALEQGKIDAETYAERVGSLDTRLTSIEGELSLASRGVERTRMLEQSMEAMQGILREAPLTFTQGDPQKVNGILRAVIDRVLVREGAVEIVWR